MAEVQQALPTHVYSVLIALKDTSLLVPNSAVAEVAGQELFTPNSNGSLPDWFLGNMRWQSRELPVISVERLMGQDMPEIDKKCRLVAMNAPAEAASFALLSRSYPMIVTLNEMAIKPEAMNEQDSAKHLYSRVTVAGRPALIPDLDALATEIRRLGL